VEPDPDRVVPVSDHVHEMCTRIQGALERAQVSMQENADSRKERYDRKARLVEYQTGQSVLVRLPHAGKPLEGAWQGPYRVKNKVGTHTYIVYMHDKRIKNPITHVNAIKAWQEPQQTVGALEACEDPHPEQGGPTSDLGWPVEDTTTELETRYDPGNYWVAECKPTGELPNMDHLADDQRASLGPLLQRYSHLFGGELGAMKGVTHDIDVGGHSPIKQNYYRVSPAQQELLRHEVNEMLRLGVIQPSQSEWGSPLILVKKPCGKWRPCVDYRRVNAVSKGDAYPLPRLDDLVDRLGGATYITTLDANKGYWQVLLTERARAISAFVTPFGHYEFIKMPFGVKGGPNTYQRAMNNLLVGLEDWAAAYLDDLSIQSETWETHLARLEQVFVRLEANGVTLNAKKCMIGGNKVVYLGHEVGAGKVAPRAAKVESLQKVPPPRTKKELRRFLGGVGFYRRFIPRFADLAVPLTDLLRGGGKGATPIQWSDACQHAFEALKGSLANQPVLRAPNFNEKFEMYSDASDQGISAILVQRYDDAPLPVCYYSRKLLPRERNYSTIEKELLAILAGLDNYRIYVGYGPLLVYSDHNPLRWLSSVKNSNQRILRWALTLSEYALEIRHMRGGENELADWLSRDFQSRQGEDRLTTDEKV
jgi:hypothetical protein